MVGGLRSVSRPARTVFSVRAAFVCGILLLLLWSLASQPLPRASAAGGVTYTVNSTDDPGDGVCTAAHCTLREAILAANATPGRDTIVCAFSGTPPFTIRPTSALPVITDSVVLDGTRTDPRTKSPIVGVELDGSALTEAAAGLEITAPDCLVRGFAIYGFRSSAEEWAIDFDFTGHGILVHDAPGTVVEGCYLGTDATGTIARPNGGAGIMLYKAPNSRIGGPTAATRNVISGNRIRGVYVLTSEGVRIAGNYVGTDVTGTRALPNGGFTISGDPCILCGAVEVAGSPGTVIGGTGAGDRNLISGNLDNGIVVRTVSTPPVLIQGNFIGTDALGRASLPNRAGVLAYDTEVVIGGVTPGAGNLISGNHEEGLFLVVSKIQVFGNLIGVAADGRSPLGNGHDGIVGSDGSSGPIGGVDPGQANVIAFNGGHGVRLLSGIAAVRGNSIMGNRGVALIRGLTSALLTNGQSFPPNNYPELFAAVLTPSALNLGGRLVSGRDAHYVVDFYANTATDESGTGEGQRYLGSAVVLTDATGIAPIVVSLPLPATDPWRALVPFFVSATATITSDGTFGTTSGFSVAVPVGTATNGDAHDLTGPIAALWTARYDAGVRDLDSASAMALGPDGRTLFVAGVSRGAGIFPGNEDAAVIAYDPASGTRRWVTRLGSAARRFTVIDGLRVTPAGDRLLLFMRAAWMNTTDEPLQIVALNTRTGAVTSILHAAGREIDGLAIRPDGAQAFIAGYRNNALGQDIAFVAGFDLVNGVEQWRVEFGQRRIRQMTTDSTGTHLYLTGSQQLIAALDTATGATVWQAPATDYHSEPSALALSRDELTLFVNGSSNIPNFNESSNFETAAIDAATGAVRWRQQFGGPFGLSDLGAFVAVTPDDRTVLVSGRLQTPFADFSLFPDSDFPSDHAVVAYDAETGTQRWAAMYDGPGNGPETPRGLTVTPDGNSVIAALDSDGEFADFTTIAYRVATGEEQWVARTNGPAGGPDRPTAGLLLSPGGTRVFVAGQSVGAGSFVDFLTAAYNLCENRFPDVPCVHWAAGFIEVAAREHLVAGFPDGSFRPETTMSRAQSAVLLARAADRIFGDFAAFSPPACGSESFSDVPCTHFAYRFIEYLVNKTIVPVAGQPTPFHPSDATTRRAMAVFLGTLRNLQDNDLEAFVPPKCGAGSFADIFCTDPDYKTIEYVHFEGIVAGFGDGTFRPDAAVTRAQMAVFLLRALNIEP